MWVRKIYGQRDGGWGITNLGIGVKRFPSAIIKPLPTCAAFQTQCVSTTRGAFVRHIGQAGIR